MSTSAFDNYASDYDSHFTHSPIGISQRKRVYKFLLPLINKQTKLLEINCGTGYDALTLAPIVQQILACDLSSEMINEAKGKKENANISNLVFKELDTNELHNNLNSSYDLLFSNFGGLNCLSSEELKKFSKNISPFITEKGQLVLVIMGKKCLWENFFFFKQKDPRIYRRMTDKGVSTTIHNATFNTYYYSPKQIETLFSEGFYVKKTRPIGFFIPPSYLNPYFLRRKRLLFLLNFLEKLVGHFFFLSNYADHYVIVFEKKQEEARRV